jgi:GAF domain-containing protein
MKYRHRIWLILLLIGLIPLAVAGIETLRIVNQIPYMPIDQTQGAVSEVEVQSVRVRFILTYSLFGFITLVAAYIISGRVASPVEWMAASASQFLRIMQNVWKSLQPPDSKNELITLGYTFSVFTQQIREEIANLEKQVKARTADLAGRTAQLEIAAQVARESAAILDIDQLLNETTQLISDRFGYYHAGIFLMDEAAEDSRAAEDSQTMEDDRAGVGSGADEYLTLQAANSEGGQRMLARGHKLKVGQGIVGTVAAKNEPRIATDVGIDAAFFNNPDLPQTRSELALPLRVRSRLIGVLDVQAIESEAYKEEDVKILQILADQLALAIDNARLIKESQRTLQALEYAYGQEAKLAWERRLAKKPLAYVYNRIDVRPIAVLPENQENSQEDAKHQLAVPILIRGQALGNIILKRDREMSPWNTEDRTLVEDAVAQIASALENARLLEEIRSRARQEQQINLISTQIRSSPTTDSILRNTVRELGNALGASRTFIQLGLQSKKSGDNELQANTPETIKTNGDSKEHQE